MYLTDCSELEYYILIKREPAFKLSTVYRTLGAAFREFIGSTIQLATIANTITCPIISMVSYNHN